MKISTKNVKAEVKTGKNKGMTTYKSQVLEVNRALKRENKSLSGCIKFLLCFSKETGLDPNRIKILRFIQKDDAAFKSFKSIVRVSKSGNHSPFYILQTLNKNLSDLNKPKVKAAPKAKVKAAPKAKK